MIRGQGWLKWIVFPGWIDKVTPPGMNRPPMTPDLPEVVFLKGEVQRVQEFGDFIGGLIRQIRRECQAQRGLLVHCLYSRVLWVCQLVWHLLCRLVLGHTQ